MLLRLDDVVTFPCGCTARIVAVSDSGAYVKVTPVDTHPKCIGRDLNEDWIDVKECMLSTLTLVDEELPYAAARR